MKEKVGRTLVEKTAEDLIAWIRDQEYEPGHKLPTEPVLAGLTGVSRNTVREALRILASRNIVTIRQGSGTFLSEKQGIPDDPLGFDMTSDRDQLTRDLLQIRGIIEPPIAALAAQNATCEDIEQLEQILCQIEERIRLQENYADQDVEFHVQIARCSHNTVMSNLVPVIGRGVSVFSSEVGETEYRQTLISHRRIFEAIRDRKPEDARQEMLFHLLFNSQRYNEEKSESI